MQQLEDISYPFLDIAWTKSYVSLSIWYLLIFCIFANFVLDSFWSGTSAGRALPHGPLHTGGMDHTSNLCYFCRDIISEELRTVLDQIPNF